MNSFTRVTWIRTSGTILLLLLMVLSAGCGRFSRSTRAMVAADRGLIKQVGLMPFELGVPLESGELRQALQSDFITAFGNACPNVAIIDLAIQSKSGQVMPQNIHQDAVALLQNGRSMGLQAIVSAGLMSLESFTRRPLLRFWQRHDLLHSLFYTDVLDMQSGARLHSSILKGSHRAGGFDLESLHAADSRAISELRHKLSQEIQNMGQTACQSVQQQAWHTFVAAVEGDRITLTAGLSSGLAVGDELTLHRLESVIESYEGQWLTVPGEPTGRVRITSVTEHHTVAQITRGSAKAGDLAKRQGRP